MASADIQQNLKCSICLNIYTDPVTLNCGHNFCRECINTAMETQDTEHRDYHCPQCRKRFRSRPKLNKNIDLCYIAEKLKSSTTLENRKCPEHNRDLEFYCMEDCVCVCVLCRLDGQHKGHEAEKLEEAFQKKKNQLKDDVQPLIAERERRLIRESRNCSNSRETLQNTHMTCRSKSMAS
uniref:Uncharacterized protein n=1 Tax=Pyxicephalus adspersus TaxID=30357 RepID=A0AAV2ZTY5_PYXAD|nr:TPA: hypothetical protein GDO54_012977 [Pyxicephalus adspersus]